MRKNKSLVRIPTSLLIFICIQVVSGCAGIKTGDYKIYCKKGDKSSIRIIPKNDPFTPISDSIVKNIEISVTNLKDFEPRVKAENKRWYEEKIKELENSAFIDLTLYKSYYFLYRSQPCEPKAYSDYFAALNSLNEKLNSTRDFKSDIEKLIRGAGISGNSDDKVITVLETYLNSIK